MFKITTRQDGQTTTLRLEGRLVGPWVAELETCWYAAPGAPGCGVIVDLTEVTFIDDEGKALLTRMWRGGAVLQAAGCLTRGIVEDITGERGGCCDSAQRKARKS
jgi:hypothetical protein